MKYLNLGTEIYQTEPCMTASDAQGWTWFKLLSYCHQQMNGGKIENCNDWPDRHWVRIGVEKSVVMVDSPLWHFAGLILHVHFYNKERETGYRKMVSSGSKGAQKRWGRDRVANGEANGEANGVKIGSNMRKKERKKETRVGARANSALDSKCEAVEYASHAKPKKEKKGKVVE